MKKKRRRGMKQKTNGDSQPGQESQRHSDEQRTAPTAYSSCPPAERWEDTRLFFATFFSSEKKVGDKG